MLKKTITFTDFNGDQATEDHYFHLSKADLVQWEVKTPGGLENHLRTLSKSNDGAKIVTEFQKIIQMAYGQRSEDGKRFLKSDELWWEFKGSEAYSEMLMELLTDSDAAAAFVNGIVPQGLDKQIGKLQVEQPKAPEPRPTQYELTAEEVQATHNVSEKPRILTREDQINMSSEELRNAIINGATLETNDAMNMKKLAEVPKPEPVELSLTQAMEMSREDLQAGLANGTYVIA